MLRSKASFRSLIMLGAASAALGQAQPLPPVAATREALAACFDAQRARVPFSGVALMALGDDVLVRTVGAADLAGAVPITRETRFRLASVSKVITRVAIGLLADQGRLSLDDRIGAHIPELPPALAAITVEQLLHHRSGLGSYASPANWAAAMRARTAHDLLPLIVPETLAFAPGEGQRYSNSGYVLLGVIIENLSGGSYGDFVRSAIFQPLGMANSGLAFDARTATPITRISGPGRPPSDRPRDAEGEDHPLGSPAGSGVSSADDLLLLGRALMGDRLLRPATKARLFPRRGSALVIGQSGGTLGVNADFSVLPETGWILVTLTNNDPPSGELMGEVLRNAALGRGCTTLTPADRPSPFSGPGPRARTPGTQAVPPRTPST